MFLFIRSICIGILKPLYHSISAVSYLIIFRTIYLGCGNKIYDGYVNVDKFELYNIDIKHDLEKFPYPFEDNSDEEIKLSHVLEHIGQVPDVFIRIL